MSTATQTTSQITYTTRPATSGWGGLELLSRVEGVSDWTAIAEGPQEAIEAMRARLTAARA